MSVDNHIDGFISFYPEHPIRTDQKFCEGSHCNPKSYEEQYGKKITEGDFLQHVRVWSKPNGGLWSDGAKQFNGTYFPTHLPLRELLTGKEGSTIKTSVLGQEFVLQCAQQQSGGWDFEKGINPSMNTFFMYPEEGKTFVTPEPFSMSKYGVMVARTEGQESGSLPSRLVEKIYFDSLERKRVCTNATLKSMYQRDVQVGKGGQGTVLKVLERQSGAFRALKIGFFPMLMENPEILTVINYVLDHGLSPHLTRVHKMLQLPTESRPELLHTGKEDFIYDAPSDKKKLLMQYGFEMELMEGDLCEIGEKLTDLEKVAIDVQMESVDEILRQFETSPDDDKYRNILYKRLDNNDTFNGKKLQDFDYWKYSLHGKDFYLPKMKYLVKRGDYDGWHCGLFVKPENKPKAIEECSSTTTPTKLRNRLTLEEAAALFPKPTDPNAKILDMSEKKSVIFKP